MKLTGSPRRRSMEIERELVGQRKGIYGSGRVTREGNERLM
jgi:anthranilate/para-aminobenzoate synthase component I